MRSEMTGEFLGAFDVELRDGMLVFSRTSGSDEGGCPPWGRTDCKSSHEREKIGPSECKRMGELWQKGRRQFIDLANLVTSDGVHLVPEHFEGNLLQGLIHVAPGKRRCSLRSERELLRLASEIGPLFGIYGSSSLGPGRDAIEEPVDAWIAAAGVALFAGKLDAFVSGQSSGRSLDGEILYFEALLKSGGREWTCWKANHFFEGGLPEPYSSLIRLSDSRLAARESLESGSFWPLGEVRSFGYAPLGRPVKVIRSRDGSSDGEVAPGDAHPPLRLIVDEGRVSRIVSVLDTEQVGEELRECPLLTFSNRRMLEGPEGYLPVAKAIAGRMLDQLIAIHSVRRVVSPRRGQASIPAHNSTLERLWASYGDGLASVRTAVCAHCGRLFVPRRKGTQIYCDYDGLNPCQKRHNEQLKQERRHARSEVTKAVRSIGDAPFDAAGIYYLLRGRVRPEMVSFVLEKMAREDDGAVVQIGTARNGGQPVYLRR